jgi:hypothetical protein
MIIGTRKRKPKDYLSEEEADDEEEEPNNTKMEKMITKI